MKSSVLLGLIIPATLVFTACKKDTSAPTPPQGSTGAMVRIQQGTDPNLINDTVYLISYNSTNQIKAVTDSINLDTLVPAYDNSGNLISITEHNTWGSSNAAYTYDANNLLTQVSYNLAGSNEKYVYAYTGGVISKRSYYSDLGLGGAQSLQGYYTYTVSGGNITDIKAYTAGGTLITDVTATYTSQPNPFKTLSLFNYGNLLGLEAIATYETWFNTNLLSSATVSGFGSTSTITFNSASAPTKIVTNDPIDRWLYTWMFSYK